MNKKKEQNSLKLGQGIAGFPFLEIGKGKKFPGKTFAHLGNKFRDSSPIASPRICHKIFILARKMGKFAGFVEIRI